MSHAAHARTSHDIAAASQFRPDIQGLRALAVILVVCCHAAVPGLEGGYVGVDVFFVISGFVITSLLRRQPKRRLRENLSYFYARRVRRIVPAATLVLVATIAATYVWLGKSVGAPLLIDVRWASLFGENWRLIETGSNYFIPGVPLSLVTQFWSLAVEEQFYIFFPLLVFGIGVLFRQRATMALTVAILLTLVASSWYSVHLSHVNAVAAYYSPFTRFWELALGALVSMVPSAWATLTPRVNAALGWVALSVIIVAATHFTQFTLYPGSLAWWPCGAAAVLLLTGHTNYVAGPGRVLSFRPVRYIGDISYSLYLWHYVWLMLPQQYDVHGVSGSARALLVLGALACAIGSYHLVENPIRHSRRLDGDVVSVGFLFFVCLLITWNVTYVFHVWG